tara:strand:+ start:1485 stop:1886 length:402 start_codon:yes stop_codon:yes gene_type:complete
MKIILMLLLFTFASVVNTSGQEKIWTDIDGKTTTKEKALYYSIFSKGKKGNQFVVSYFFSGKKALEYYFVDGRKVGKSVQFYTTGEVKTTGEFKEGFKAGMWKTYYENGKIREKGKYSKGEKVGVWKTFYKNN